MNLMKNYLMKTFIEMSDNDLRKAFEEYLQHETTGALHDGILRNIADQDNSAMSVFNTESALLREIANRWFNKR